MSDAGQVTSPRDGIPFGVRPDGTHATRFVVGDPDGLHAAVTDHGATLVALYAPDRDGQLADVVLGFNDVCGYAAPSNPYLGATVGRVANRIANARFDLGGRRFDLAANEGSNHLHGGGPRAFSQVVWQLADLTDGEVVLRHVSPDGDEGYPGRVEVTATYGVTHDALTITYRATTDAPTPLDLTNHAYLNLRGHDAGDVLDHDLTVGADHVVEVDAVLIPTGTLRDVAGTPLDLRSPTMLRSPVTALADTPALGLDHHLVLHRGQDPDDPGRGAAGGDGRVRPVAWLREPTSGRRLELATDQPGLQVYTGNRLDGSLTGKGGRRYQRHAGLCLEAHHLPDAVHHPGFPSIVLTPDRTYEHTTVLRFSAD